MRVWIRADGNPVIASGHLRRTLSIARELRGLGCEVVYIFADDDSRDCFRKIVTPEAEEWPCRTLGVPYGHPMEELCHPEILTHVRETDWILVDSYAATQEYYLRLRGVTAGRIAVLDDMMFFDPAADMVIHYAPDEKEAQRFYHRAPIRLLGARYAPLRRQFAGLKPEIRAQVSTVLISTGGTDPFGMAKELGHRMHQAGLATRFLAPGHAPVEDVAGLMSGCDLAVSAGGTTLYELCAAGIPTAAYAMADNQALFAGKMAAAGACTYMGDVRAREREALLRDIDQWSGRRRSPEGGLALRAAESARMRGITDGYGARRIAQTLVRGKAGMD